MCSKECCMWLKRAFFARINKRITRLGNSRWNCSRFQEWTKSISCKTRHFFPRLKRPTESDWARNSLTRLFSTNHQTTKELMTLKTMRHTLTNEEDTMMMLLKKTFVICCKPSQGKREHTPFFPNKEGILISSRANILIN